MKIVTSILFLLLVSASFSGCKKKLFDYRNKYSHKYHFTYTYEEWDLFEGIVESGTGTFDGTISYTKSDPGDQMTIHFDSDKKVTVLVAENGNIALDCGPSIGSFHGKKKCNLSFETNACGGSMGFWTKYKITGTKN